MPPESAKSAETRYVPPMILSVSPTYWADRIDTVTTVTRANTRSWIFVARRIMWHPRSASVTAMSSPRPRTRTPVTAPGRPARGIRLRRTATAQVSDPAVPVGGPTGSAGVAAAVAGRRAVPARELLVVQAGPGSVARCAG